MTEKYDNTIVLGYNYDKWYGYGEQEPITLDMSTNTNSHSLICGMSGSGKSYATTLILAKIARLDGKVYFADYKQDDMYAFLIACPRYYPYKDTLDALDEVYNVLQLRQSGEDASRTQITLFWDEYIANVLALLSEDKKKAESVLRKVSEILMLGRSLAINLVITCQRADASAFPSGSRLNFGCIMILGSQLRSIYEMLVPDHMDMIGTRQFKQGEGVVLFQGSTLRFIKIGKIKNSQLLQELCIDALTRE